MKQRNYYIKETVTSNRVETRLKYHIKTLKSLMKKKQFILKNTAEISSQAVGALAKLGNRHFKITLRKMEPQNFW